MNAMRFWLLALAVPTLAFQIGTAPPPASRRCASPAAQFELPDFSKMASDLSKMASPPESANEPTEDGEPKKGKERKEWKDRHYHWSLDTKALARRRADPQSTKFGQNLPRSDRDPVAKFGRNLPTYW